jgi:hypothetical protein
MFFKVSHVRFASFQELSRKNTFDLLAKTKEGVFTFKLTHETLKNSWKILNFSKKILT